jgi:protein tyrosine phosphatase (PTP) superfamily phosphohydrolase (DUF442 family)
VYKRFILAATLASSIIVAVIAFTASLGSSSASRGELDVALHGASISKPKDDSAEVKTTLPLFHRLNETYTRGGEPRHGGIETLIKLGIRVIVDLRSIYDYRDDIKQAAEQVGLIYRWLPMSVWNPPTDEQAREFIRIVSDKSQGPFYVFCADGLNRTGEMSAIYRVANDGWSVEQSLKEMDELGFNPYYYTLRNYVWDYARKFHPRAVPLSGRRVARFELGK